MFWANNYVSSPNIEALLNKEDVTLHELMDEEDILQECKSQNKKLIDYLIRSDVMEELITITTREPSTDIEERWRYKYPNVACELLTCDVPVLNEKLAGNEALLAKLYSFIDTDQPLNPLLASFFSKTIGVLIGHKTVQNWYSYQFTCLQLLEFLKSRQTCVDLLLQHLETSAIMDLVLKLVSQVEGNMRQNILNWLDSQQLVQRVVKLLSPNSEPSKHANAAQLLCDMITAAREYQRTSTARAGPDPILNTLESADTVSLLLETILTGEKLESSILGGIQVLLTLLPKANNGRSEDSVQGNGIEDDITDSEERIKISNATLPYLEQLHKLLLDPPYKPPVKTTTGVLECPVGITRLHVAKLFTTLMATENVKVYGALVELGTFQTLLDLFFKYMWNNFLHTQVQFCLALAINCDFKDTNDIIYVNIFNKCRLIDRILEAWDKNDSKQNKEIENKQGYMGHLINIANNIVNQREKNENLDKFLKDNLSPECLNKWDNFVNVELTKINKTHQILLGGRPQASMTSSSGSPDEYSSYPQEEFLQVQRVEQFYTNYLGQHMTTQFPENFGFHDDQFNDGDDALHNSVDQLTTMSFTISEEDLDKREDMFNKICQQKQKADLEDCNTVVEWGDEGELTFQTVVDKRDWPTKQQHNDSNSSDEDDEDTRDMHMEIDSTESWGSTEPLPTNTTLPEVNPWDMMPSEPVESIGWANFDNFENTLNMGNAVIIDNKLCDDGKKETSNITVENKMDTALGSKATLEAVGAGDMKIEDSVDSTASYIETNINHQSKESNLYSDCTADKNANPSEIVDSREIKCEGNIQNTEVATTTVQNEKSSSDYKIPCNLKNVSSEAVLSSTDTK
ncbi:phosphatase 6 regulatory subunit 1-like protein fmt [Bombus vancouverensis nearcticus]|uniref:phosphatase 6 regulatory subunit 1-like protein fmt n=1 Tax=Bombus vancouverensis nearcticus TaxID=2705178 RepID=UPI00143BC8E2|nr:serine/threonine-protein phosphatase 6 regulatory subunit 3 [Bombus vancouverensis nearcticus]XP_033183136.1 serine/threonine-protein phosphatase 6 regulatory subunit 3 [Bombus vancouverensis nearcticus]XP_033183138.1 serine/threonine-protein phosphatase 6 regulatory subunit 3 [Bombus vancouverensis nearcticus]XP_033183139.1 serine/threonine-protein phosphatase 6 regulatory subunit 3 [Bombus vancouverensis nearcticus]